MKHATPHNSPQLHAQLEERLGRYVAMPTVTGDHTACLQGLQVIAAELRSLGLKVHIFGTKNPWLIATTRPRVTHVRVLLNAHLDVVPPNHISQFAMNTDNDRLIGRGVFDMKFALACYLQALTELAKQDRLSVYDLGVLVTTDEESGGFHGAKVCIDNGWTADITIVPDGGRDFKIEKRAKGFRAIYLHARGKATHSSRPWEGVNPLNAMLPAIRDIMAKYPNDNADETTVAINKIDSPEPSGLTQVSSHLRALLDVRAFTDEELDAAQIFLQGVAKRYDMEYECHLTGAPVSLQEENPLVRMFIECQTEVLGKPAEFTQSLGASDARYFSAEGMATIVEYPHGGNAHSAGEWLSRESLHQFYMIIHNFAVKAALDHDGAPPRRILAAPKKIVRHLLKSANR